MSQFDIFSGNKKFSAQKNEDILAAFGSVTNLTQVWQIRSKRKQAIQSTFVSALAKLGSDSGC